MIRRFVIALLVAATTLVGFASPAFAHNTLQSTDPADGAVLDTTPGALSFNFDLAVPLDSASVELIDAANVRVPLPGLTLAAGDNTTVTAPLPTLTPGDFTARWRLVGVDGHVLTGRVSFTLRQPAAAAGQTDTTVDVATSTAPAVELTETPRSVPGVFRWMLRIIGYAGLIAVGVALVGPLLAARLGSDHRLARFGVAGAVAIVLTSGLQLVVLGRDLGGGLGDAVDTQVGWALLLRIFAALIMIGALEIGMRTSAQGDLAALAGMVTLLAATWAYAGHARSQRWPIVGVLLDVGHTLGALTWLGGLVAIVRLTRRHVDHGEIVGVMQRFTDIAKTSVGVIAITGVVQSLRIDGWPWQLLSTTHGRVLLAKLFVVALLLYVANVNRQRIAARFQRSDSVTTGSLMAVRRAVTTEVVVSAVVLALTAALVASSAQ